MPNPSKCSRSMFGRPFITLTLTLNPHPKPYNSLDGPLVLRVSEPEPALGDVLWAERSGLVLNYEVPVHVVQFETGLGRGAQIQVLQSEGTHTHTVTQSQYCVGGGGSGSSENKQMNE